MTGSKLRRQIAWQAARLMHTREESEYFQAKQKAARQIVGRWLKTKDLPSNTEIRDQVQILSRLHDQHDEGQTLRRMRCRALWWMRQLQPFHPRLIGSVLSGGIRAGSDIDLHVFTNHLDSLCNLLVQSGSHYEVERKRLIKDKQLRVFTHVHVRDEFPVELTVYQSSLLGHRFRSSITGKPIQRATSDQLQRLIEIEHQIPAERLDATLDELDHSPDRFTVYLALLIPLEEVRENPKYHPEGDALHHSLQVFELARQYHAYDEEFLLAALLHDVGKAIDSKDHVTAGLEALDGFISQRTAWLISHHMEAHRVRDRTIGQRRLRRLKEHPWFNDLMKLNQCDRAGRVAGAVTCCVEEAIDAIEQLGDFEQC